MVEVYKNIKLHSSKSGKISIANITNPYGMGSDDVLSIGICLKNNQPEWKVHIPYENLEELIETLEKISQTKIQQKE